MMLKTILSATLLYLVCFVGAFLLLIHEFMVGSLSPRFALPLFMVAAAVSGLVLIKRAARPLRSTVGDPVDPLTRGQRKFAIRAGKVWTALLVLGLLVGLSRAKNFPLWATLVAVTINLLITAALVSTVVRLRKNLK